MYDNTIFVALLIVCVIIYMLPTVVAFGRDIPRRHAVTLLNIILGWTLVVWVILFVWAMMAETAAEEPV